jgi:DNA primase small subunit
MRTEQCPWFGEEMNANTTKEISLRYVGNVFSEYYKENAKALHLPSLMERREFAFLLFSEKIMLRHKGFKNQNELALFLESIIPSDIYHSCAYYDDPTADMEKKGWLGADLIFDIDAYHISTPCNKVHDEWTCSNCGFVGRGITPQNCPLCNSQKFTIKSWYCEVCLECAKQETCKLLDMLMKDFGISKSEIQIFFSGHRGYHVHVENEAVKLLDTVARKEIVDYVSGLGMDVSFYRLGEKNRKRTKVLMSPSLVNFGWNRRLADGMRSFILNAKEDDLLGIGIRKNVVDAVLRNKDLIAQSLLNISTDMSIRGVGFGSWKKIAEHSIKLQSAKIDTVVTTDIHRLIRLAGTLHGKTGLKKAEVSISNIEEFDPFKSAIAFRKGTVTVFVSNVPEFRLSDEIFGPYKNQKVELPTAAAVLLICKNRAEVVEKDV